MENRKIFNIKLIHKNKTSIYLRLKKKKTQNKFFLIYFNLIIYHSRSSFIPKSFM